MIFTCEVIGYRLNLRIWINWTGSIIYIGKWVVSGRARICASWYEIEIATITLQWLINLLYSQLENLWNDCLKSLWKFYLPLLLSSFRSYHILWQQFLCLERLLSHMHLLYSTLVLGPAIRTQLIFSMSHTELLYNNLLNMILFELIYTFNKDLVISYSYCFEASSSTFKHLTVPG